MQRISSCSLILVLSTSWISALFGQIARTLMESFCTHSVIFYYSLHHIRLKFPSISTTPSADCRPMAQISHGSPPTFNSGNCIPSKPRLYCTTLTGTAQIDVSLQSWFPIDVGALRSILQQGLSCSTKLLHLLSCFGTAKDLSKLQPSGRSDGPNAHFQKARAAA